MSSSTGTRRQLPPWMLRVGATDQVSKSVSEVINKKNGLEGLPKEACQPKSSGEVKLHSSEVASCQSESTKTDSHLLRKCKTTRSRRKLVKPAEDDLSKMHEGGLEKENHAPPRRKRKAKVLKATRSHAVEESTLSEDELSVDDLISIAKEYINSEKTQEGQRKSLAEYESESLPRRISSKDKISHRDNAPSSNSTLNVNTSEASSSDLADCPPSERAGVIDFSKTGDVAQEMLELFLGPLFNRPSEVNTYPEPVTNSVTLNYVSRSPTRDESVGEALPLATRKKVSLKDKVAMLLSGA